MQLIIVFLIRVRNPRKPQDHYLGYIVHQKVGIWITWTPKVCTIIAFYRFWAIILPTFGGLGKDAQPCALSPS